MIVFNVGLWFGTPAQAPEIVSCLEINEYLEFSAYYQRKPIPSEVFIRIVSTEGKILKFSEFNRLLDELSTWDSHPPVSNWTAWLPEPWNDDWKMLTVRPGKQRKVIISRRHATDFASFGSSWDYR